MIGILRTTGRLPLFCNICMILLISFEANKYSILNVRRASSVRDIGTASCAAVMDLSGSGFCDRGAKSIVADVVVHGDQDIV